MKDIPIAFIGGGNMARSLIGGLIADGYDPDCIWVAEPDASQREFLRSRFGVHTGADNPVIAAKATVIVLAVKPQLLQGVAQQLAAVIQGCPPLVISIAAGVRELDLRRWLGGGSLALVRTMPNTPALVSSGASALFANEFVSEDHRQLAESLLRAVGVTVWVNDERLLDVVTALSGSGPAYFFLLMEVLEQAGAALGLDADTARLLTLQTAFGAAKMALESAESPATLRVRVTSPGGTTERALTVLCEGGMELLVSKALEAARHRAKELGDLLGGQL
ncbi:MAG: pyrroline-5-carboxylate reductase [Candidatus Competibacteraceae bacterium]|uniref:Pyrroline-5-carboxylate reductase n=1 Tax=Candidatus Contendobacter odensis Run_B_J11 TaxID=1400861 RepID=A0A7U7GD95_9GAMM|nr:pyrroline-5-carboxylate reductase [Candidatus Contendobacter odensis]MBK8537627.1 pyrroline-5-carboxylate reductase [Candidatus Competibacteraceae bacterium]CDH46285.1 pyrroline-5-carboxylate reductase [Candidatus Contendobacter odensis Run_B_J11]